MEHSNSTKSQKSVLYVYAILENNVRCLFECDTLKRVHLKKHCTAKDTIHKISATVYQTWGRRIVENITTSLHICCLVLQEKLLHSYSEQNRQGKKKKKVFKPSSVLFLGQERRNACTEVGRSI